VKKVRSFSLALSTLLLAACSSGGSAVPAGAASPGTPAGTVASSPAGGGSGTAPVASSPGGGSGTAPVASPATGSAIGQVFPASNPWNQDISNLPVHPSSDDFIASIGRDTGLHPDFGTVWNGAPSATPRWPTCSAYR
jgi:hypothetical protein